MNNRYLAGIFLLTVGPDVAQPMPPNTAGVSFESFEFNEGSPQTVFWSAIMGQPQGVIMMGTMSFLTFPDSRFGVLLVSKKPTGGTSGSVVNHLGLRVRNLPDTLARVRAGGFKIEQNTESRQAFIYSPEDLKIEAMEDPLMAAPVQWDHVHFYTEVPEQMRDWYAKAFGALPDNSGSVPAADLPGIRLLFSKSKSATAATKNRVMDHIRFAVSDVEQFRARLQTEGAALEPPQHYVPPQRSTFARLTDPWGTYIELVEAPAR